MHIIIASHVFFAVVRDVLFAVIANDSLYAWSPDPSILLIEGYGSYTRIGRFNMSMLSV